MAVEYAGSGNDDGIIVGRAASDKIGFYGLGTAVSRRAAACQATSTLTTASSADVTTALMATILEVMDTLNGLGIWKGSA